MNRLYRLLSVPAVCLVVSAAPVLHAQSKASLHGQVTDPSGAIVPGASVQLSGGGKNFFRHIGRGWQLLVWNAARRQLHAGRDRPRVHSVF